ncbi:cytotoxic and regulatory T-cell molecule isoform X1 [Hippoglossus stenolepis]|uniref:cytotoxic and regulatory T-cell molecule isoform X1 n=1 Tax=Hippoglossus stenolepis TaxID=195615 RepID=UPI001FAF5C9A|nr:cytotoxic and regulatory T-cell molecule isoform X1 [Hippoglossus stenolepis]
MEVKLLLTVFMLLVQVSLALWQRVTVMKGQTLDLSCPISNPHKTTVEWRNPKGYIMFFNRNKALKDKRYRIDRLSESEFSISISNITFKDGGNYTCSHYDHHTKEKIVEVTVLGYPRMKVAEHEGQLVIKCTAEGNHYPPQISWKVGQWPEIRGHAQVHHEDKTYVSVDMLHVQQDKKRVTVKCLVRHPALLSPPLMNFVKIGQGRRKFHRTTTTSLPTAAGSAEVPTTTSGSRHETTSTVHLTTTDANGPPSESSIQLSAVSSNHPFPSREPQTVSASSRSPINPDTGSHLSTTGWTSVSETTEEITSYNSTGRNPPGSTNDPRMQTGSQGNSSLLVFLVTCLIVCLLIVVTFFAIKLRRAHITWKKVFIVTENEDSNPSEESSKSKSSQEEKNSKGQRRRGLFNTAFTQYVAEEPAVIPSNTGAMSATESVNQERTSEPQPPSQSSAQCDIKETEL